MDYSALVALLTFAAGILLSPVMKKWDNMLNSRTHLDNLYIEIEDCCTYLENIIKSHFDLLFKLETQKTTESLIPKMPIPLIDEYDTQFIHMFYAEALKTLNPAQRNTIRIIDNTIVTLLNQSEQLQTDVLNENLYNVRSIRNIISKSCYLYYHLQRMHVEKERYTGNQSLNSFDSTMHVLQAFGYTLDAIKKADALKTMLTKEEINALSNNQTHSIPG
jgi:hypothetical protein